jgi:hypothetical protein
MANYKGGGGYASQTKQSKQLDEDVKKCAIEVVKEINKQYMRKLRHISSLSHPSLGKSKNNEDRKIMPDMGLILDENDNVIFSGDGKRQWIGGNATQRLGDVLYFLREYINPNVSFILFGCGYIEKDGPLYNTLLKYHYDGRGGYNEFIPTKTNVFLKESFTKSEIKNIIKDSLIQHLNLSV